MVQPAEAVTFSWVIPQILTASADLSTLLAAGTLGRQSKMQSRNIGKTHRLLPAIMCPKSIGHPPEHSELSSMRLVRALELRPPSYWIKFQTTIFVCSQPSSLLLLWPGFRVLRLCK